jgi:hypothetical protein
VEGPVQPGGDQQPVDHGGSVAGPDNCDVIRIGRRVLGCHSGDQLEEEGNIIRLALLIVDVPAPLVPVGGRDDHIFP